MLRIAATRVRLSPAFHNVLCNARRPFSISSAWSVAHRRHLGALALSSALGASAYFYLQQPVSSDSGASEPVTTTPHVNDNRHRHRDKHGGQPEEEPFSSLIRTYLVYSMCSIPWLVDYSPRILEVLSSIPVVKQVTEAIVRVTFFAQFVGGETALETVPVLEKLRAENKGAMLHFGAEVDEKEVSSSSPTSVSSSSKKRGVKNEIVDEIIRCIDVAGDFEDARLEKLKLEKRKTETGGNGRKTWVAIKLTALIPDPHTFINFSKHLLHSRPRPSSSSSSPAIPFPGIPHTTDLSILSSTDALSLPPTCPLTAEDLESLRALRDALHRICTRAQERGVVLCVDAEHSWYQPAIEAFQLSLMREFNRAGPESKSTQPLVYGTFQTYLRRGREHLERSLQDAEEGGYALGVKLVRGAYHPLEVASHNARHPPPSLSPTADSSVSVSASKPNPNPDASMSISPDALPPVWATKEETDACFDECARMLVRRVADDVFDRPPSSRSSPSSPWSLSSALGYGKNKEFAQKEKLNETPTRTPTIGVVFGTHNPRSCALVLDALVQEGLAHKVLVTTPEGPSASASASASASEPESKEDTIFVLDKEAVRRVAVGQLYGMCDELSSGLASRIQVAHTHTHSDSDSAQDSEAEQDQAQDPFVFKYIPYGPLSRVMPYLGRRAIENKSVLRGSSPGSSGSEEEGSMTTSTSGSASAERQRAMREMKKRVRRFFGLA